MQNLCVESLFEKLQLHMIMAKKKKKKKKKRSLLACVALVFNKINHWTTGTLCDIMEKKNIVWKLVFMHLSIVGKLTSRMNCI